MRCNFSWRFRWGLTVIFASPHRLMVRENSRSSHSGGIGRGHDAQLRAAARYDSGGEAQHQALTTNTRFHPTAIKPSVTAPKILQDFHPAADNLECHGPRLIVPRLTAFAGNRNIHTAPIREDGLRVLAPVGGFLGGDFHATTMPYRDGRKLRILPKKLCGFQDCAERSPIVTRRHTNDAMKRPIEL